MKYVFLLQNGDRTHPDPGKNVAKCWKDGYILAIESAASIKSKWDEMLLRGKCSQADYDAAQISPGVFQMPNLSPVEKKEFIFLALDEDLTQAEIDSYLEEDETDNGDGSVTTHKLRKKKINISTITYFSNSESARRNLSAPSVADLRDKTKLIEPRYDKPFLKAEIENI